MLAEKTQHDQEAARQSLHETNTDHPQFNKVTWASDQLAKLLVELQAAPIQHIR